MQSEYSIGEVVAAAALQALVFGVVQALIDRLGARVFERVTGEWPGDYGSCLCSPSLERDAQRRRQAQGRVRR